MKKAGADMENYIIIRMQEHGELLELAAEWFHSKWKIPKAAYLESMEACIKGGSPVPQWYVIMDGEQIIAGLGVIENDFHERKDLAPNVCAVYVEKEYRKQGIAGKMLNFVCEEFAAKGIDILYLSTDHTSFYERYGWEFYCMVKEEGVEEMSRMYRHVM